MDFFQNVRSAETAGQAFKLSAKGSNLTLPVLLCFWFVENNGTAYPVQKLKTTEAAPLTQKKFSASVTQKNRFDLVFQDFCQCDAFLLCLG